MSAQQRFREIYAEKAAMNGGYSIGGSNKPKSKSKSKKKGGCKERNGNGVAIGGGKPNPWVAFVTNYSEKHNIGYGEALRDPKVQAAYKRWKA